MAGYTVRVELHVANQGNYLKLHAAMARAGYLNTVTADNGVVFRLPTAEYNLEQSPLTATQVMQQVIAIADSVKLGAWVLVTEAVRRAWQLAPKPL